MSTITTRSGKGSPLTNNEVDSNFTNLNTDKAELSGATFTGEIVANGGIALGDSDKATFGAGDDLQIYHDGSASYIVDAGAGDLTLQSGNDLLLQDPNAQPYLNANQNGGVQLYYNGDQKFITTATGIDVTGTATMDGLTVDATTSFINIKGANGDNSYSGINLKTSWGNTSTDKSANKLAFYASDGDVTGGEAAFAEISTKIDSTWTSDSNINGSIYLRTSEANSIKDRLRVAGNGDISFYEDTGTTPKFFWDASAESLGIGTDSPSEKLELIHNGANRVRFSLNDTGNNLQFWNDNTPTFAAAIGTGNPTSTLSGTDGLKFDIYNGSWSEAMRIDSSGNVGIGTSSPSAPLSVMAETSASVPAAGADSSHLAVGKNDQYGTMIGSLGSGDGYIQQQRFDGTATTYDLLLQPNGGNVGIGTSSPDTLMEIASTSPVLRITNTTDAAWSAGQDIGRLSFYSTDASAVGPHETAFILNESDFGSGVTQLSGALSFGTAAYNAAATERMRIDSSGNVGIGTDSPTGAKLRVVAESGSNVLGVGTTTQGLFIKTTGTTVDYNSSGDSGGEHTFSTGNTERMRIDSSGNVLVGKTVANLATTGVEIDPNGILVATKNAGTVAYFNRLTTDGIIADFRKDGTTVGSIGTLNRLTIGNAATGLSFNSSTVAVQPHNMTTNAATDNTIDLGVSGARFKDLYLSGNINTSTVTVTDGVYIGGNGFANKLDDYEEGTWTPTVYGTATAGTATYAQRVGTYTKVGNLAYVQLYVIFSSFTGTSEMRISDLPFTPENGAYENHMGSVMLHNIALPSGTVQVTPRATDGQTFLALRVTKDNASSTAVSCDAAGEIIISITYRTT